MFDKRLITGVIVGAVVGVHYYSTLTVYLPVLIVLGIIMLLHLVRR